MRAWYIRMGWQSCRHFGERDSCWSLVDATVYVCTTKLWVSGNVLSMLRALGIGASDNHVSGFPACREPCTISEAGCACHVLIPFICLFHFWRSSCHVLIDPHPWSRPRSRLYGTICPLILTLFSRRELSLSQSQDFGF